MNRNRSFMVFSRGYLHLYTNPTARKHWCDQNKEQFVLPPPPQQQHVIGYAVQQQPPAYTIHQHPPGYGIQQPVYAVPHHHPPGYATEDQNAYHEEQHGSSFPDYQADVRDDHIYEQHFPNHGRDNSAFQ